MSHRSKAVLKAVMPAIVIFITLAYLGCKEKTKGESEVSADSASVVDIQTEIEQVTELEAVELEQRSVMQVQGGSSISGQGGIAGYGAGRLHPQSAAGLVASYEQQFQFHTEEYDVINENEFLKALDNPLSTFSIDVDAASYSNVRRFINNGQLPPIDAVRIEELVNYFTYDYPQPKGEMPFSATTEISECPWNKENRLLHIGLQGKKIPLDEVPPSNLVFLLDVSGSMSSPNKLPLLKSAFKMLVDQLRAQDFVSIVVYAGDAGQVLPPTSGDRKEEILEAISRLEAGGSTAGGKGIQLTYRTAKENFISAGNNRVILATDGDFNVGVSSDAELVRMIEEKRKEGIYLTVLGFGTGNYKDSKMEQLADKGNGNYAYIDNILEAKKTLVNEFGATMFTIAKDVKIQIEFNPAKVQAYRLVGYENRLLKKEDFHDDTKDAGEMGAGHTVTVLYELILVGVDAELPIVDTLKYQQTQISLEALKSKEMLTLKLRYKFPEDTTSQLQVVPVKDKQIKLNKSSDNFRFAAAVAEFGMLLRDSKFKGNAAYDNVIELAKSSRGEDEEGYRAEFIQLAKACKSLPERSITGVGHRIPLGPIDSYNQSGSLAIDTSSIIVAPDSFRNPTTIGTIIESKHLTLQRCLEKYKKRDTLLNGFMEVSFVILADGTTTQVSIRSSWSNPLFGAEVDDLVRLRISRWRFTPISEGETLVKFKATCN